MRLTTAEVRSHVAELAATRASSARVGQCTSGRAFMHGPVDGNAVQVVITLHLALPPDAAVAINSGQKCLGEDEFAGVHRNHVAAHGRHRAEIAKRLSPEQEQSDKCASRDGRKMGEAVGSPVSCIP